jgi:hypothetical protein
MPINPFLPSHNQAVAWAYPTITDIKTEAPIGDWGSIGTITSDLSSGEITAQHLSTFASFFAMRWYGFVAPTLPVGSSIAGIYPVCEAIEWDTTSNFNVAYGISGAVYLISGGGGGVSAPGFNGPPSATDEPVTYGTYYAASIGTTLSALTSASILAQFYTTIPVTGNGTLRVSLPRMAIYYNAPILPIGHGANCNAYDPIAIADGSVTAPGNGLLIS